MDSASHCTAAASLPASPSILPLPTTAPLLCCVCFDETSVQILFIELVELDDMYCTCR